jgi:DNA gyrase subunit B
MARDATKKTYPAEQYDRDSVQVLRPTEHIRQHTGMYNGDRRASGLYVLVDNTLYQWIHPVPPSRAASVANLVLGRDGTVRIDLDGVSIPTGGNGPAASEAFHTWAQTSFGRWNFPLGVAAALSQSAVITTCQGERCETQTFVRGEPAGPPSLSVAAPGDRLTIDFQPDPEIFVGVTVPAERLRQRIRELAWLFSGIRFGFEDEVAGVSDRHATGEGLSGFVHHLAGTDRIVAGPVVLSGEADGVVFDVALIYTDGQGSGTRSFVNTRETLRHGTHVTGFRTALTRSLNDFARQEGLPVATDTAPGLTAVVAVRLVDPMWYGATKETLLTPEARTVLASHLRRSLREYWAAHPDVARAVLRRLARG